MVPSILGLVIFVCTGALQDQPVQPRWLPEKDLDASFRLASDPRRLVLKLQDDTGAQAVDGRLVPRAEVASVRSVLAGVSGLRVEPLFSVPINTLRDLRRRGESRTGRALADLTQYFVLSLPAGVDSREVARRLLALQVVESVSGLPLPALPPGDVLPPTSDYTGQQGYLGAAPSGVDAMHGWTLPGGTGAGVTIVDVEYNWTWSHEDLQNRGGAASHLGPPPTKPGSWSQTQWDSATHHGSAAFGVLAADNDSAGVSGLAYDATVRTVAAHTGAGLGVADAILRALTVLAPGDVILLEQQFKEDMGGPLWPVELNDPEFAVIQLATASGVHVVEAAGNGGQDLDQDPRFDLSMRDSGAILVGAGSAGSPRSRQAFSNFGSRVDVHAWGESVVTLGYGDLAAVNGPTDFDQLYTSTFAGTSSASAIVAGTVAALEGIHRQAWGGRPMQPDSLRQLMRSTGVESANPRTDKIGTQPDIRSQAEILFMGPRPGLVATGDANQFLGRSVSGAGDVDGDGTPDVLFGAPGLSLPILPGRVHVHSGRTGVRIRTLVTGTTGDLFGYSIAASGDVDGDLRSDIIIGAPNANQVHLYSGGTGALIRTFSGLNRSRFGWSVAGPGDLNGNGAPDIVVGAPGDFFFGLLGEVHVFDGGTGQLLQTIPAEALGHEFGQDVAGVPDVNGDGRPDFVVGARRGSPTGSSPGRAYLYSGASQSLIRTFTGATDDFTYAQCVAGTADIDGDGRGDLLIGTTKSAFVYSGSSGAQLFHLTDPFGDPSSSFGIDLAGLGDTNQDSVPDFCVGDPGSLGAGSGLVHVFSGADGSLLETYFSEPSGGGFGGAVAGPGDCNGDGRGDVLMGAYSGGPQSGGRGYLFLSEGAVPKLQQNGIPQSGQQVSFSVTGVDPSLAGETAQVVFSLSGISYSKRFGGIFPLVWDPYTTLGLVFGQLYRGTVNPQGNAQTPSSAFPPANPGIHVYAAAVIFDATSRISSTLPPIVFTTQ
ncbi:MAG: FG-GAP-like repeat-containing protein [Planctomycetota bacterium]